MRPTPAQSVLLALFLPFLAAACAAEPYKVTAPSVPLSKYGHGAAQTLPNGDSKRAQPRTIAVCYNGAFSEPADVLTVARENCPGKGKIIRVDDDVFWNNCSLSKPTRTTFICFPGPAKPSEFK